MHPLEQALLTTAALGAVLSVSLTIYLLALRLIAWDPVPAAALPHIDWWRRHLRPCLYTALVLTVLPVIVTLLL